MRTDIGVSRLTADDQPLPVIEVSFGPDLYIEWPHFIATAVDPRGEFLYELGQGGWRLTFFAGDDGTMKVGEAGVHPDVEDALWRGAACLTGTPDLEVVAVPIIPGGALSSEASS